MKPCNDVECVCVCVWPLYLSLSWAQLLLPAGVLFCVSYRTLCLRGGSLFDGILPSTSPNQPWRTHIHTHTQIREDIIKMSS